MSEGRERVAYIASQELAKISSLLPSNRNRSLLVHSLASALGLLRDDPSRKRLIQVVNPSRATRQALSTYHSKDYLDFVLSPHPDPKDLEDDRESLVELGLEDASSSADSPLFPGLEDYVPLVAGATLTAIETLKSGFAEIAICWDGGRHHAHKSKASGFCYVADIILALLSLKKLPTSSLSSPSPPLPKPKPRIMYLDLDLHFSDGVSEAFHQPNPQTTAPQILTLSIHHTSPGFFPASSLATLPDPPSDSGFDPFTLSIPLAQGASNATYKRMWPLVDRTRELFNPDYVVIQCGADGLAGDPYAVLNWSLGGEGSMGWYIEKILAWPGRKLLLGGGGYNSPNVARAWAYLTSIALGGPLDLETSIPDNAVFPQYAPSFTMDVPPGFMQDTNKEEDLKRIEEAYKRIFVVLEERIRASGL